jgi:hypothetical protein
MASSWATLNSVAVDCVIVVCVIVAGGITAEAAGCANASGGGRATANDVTKTTPRTTLRDITLTSVAMALACDGSFVALAFADDALVAGVLLAVLQRRELGRVD